jgi:hypothetical protein
MRTHPHLQAHGVYTYIVRGDSRHTHLCAYAHAVLAYLHVLACTPTRAWYTYIMRRDSRHTHVCACACIILWRPRVSAHSIYIHCARRLETHSRTYVHASFFGALESPRIVYTYSVRGDSRHTHVCACAHAVLAYLHVVACTPTRAWCIHALCAETRDTLTYTCAHTELAYLHTYTRMVCMHTSSRHTHVCIHTYTQCATGHPCTRMHTYTRMVYTYTVRGDSRHTHVYMRTCLASRHPCTHTRTSTCMRMVYNTSCAQRLETHLLVHTHMLCKITSMNTHAHLHVHSMHTLCAQRLETHFFMYTYMPG